MALGFKALKCHICDNQGWQYDMVRSEFAYDVPHTLNRTVPAHRNRELLGTKQKVS